MFTGRTVSIVDDDASVRRALSSLLRSWGVSSHAFSAAAALLMSPHLAESECLIVDVHMPGMTGLELQHVLAVEGRQIPIIFMTAFPDRGTERRALDAGATCFLTKPFDAEQMEMCLGRAFASASPAR